MEVSILWGSRGPDPRKIVLRGSTTYWTLSFDPRKKYEEKLLIFVETRTVKSGCSHVVMLYG